jgi:hypothetical protein
MSAVFAAYPLIFRNKGCSKLSVWGKVTTRPPDVSLLGGLLDLAANAVKEQGGIGGYRAGLLAATEHQFKLVVRKNVVILLELSGGTFDPPVNA